MKLQITNYKLGILTWILITAAIAAAQVAPLASSHAPVLAKPAQPGPASTPAKPAVRVNGAVLTETDVLREMYSIFPYARVHNGVPKELEPEIRKGAIEMLVFEELLYQEATRRNLAIAPERMSKAEATLRKQFPDPATYNHYLRTECNGSKAVLREKIRRSLLIEQMLKSEIDEKAVVTLAATKAYYDTNAKQFEHGEKVAIQTISIIPPADASAAMKEEAKAKIKDIARLGRAAKTKRDFGLIAEQLSEDDWRTRLGDRGTMDMGELPPEVAKAARSMKPAEVSEPIQIGSAWVVIRVNAHTPAGKTPFAQAKAKLQSELHKQKREEIRAALNQKLRKHAKIELL